MSPRQLPTRFVQSTAVALVIVIAPACWQWTPVPHGSFQGLSDNRIRVQTEAGGVAEIDHAVIRYPYAGDGVQRVDLRTARRIEVREVSAGGVSLVAAFVIITLAVAGIFTYAGLSSLGGSG